MNLAERYGLFQGLSAPFPSGEAQARVDEVDIGDGIRVPAILPDTGSRAERLSQALIDAPAAFRALGPADEAGTPIRPITTALVLGTPMFRPTFVDLLFPPTVPVDTDGRLARTKRFRWARWGTKHLERFNTRLGEFEPYGFAEIDRTFEAGTIETHGLAVRLGDEERAEAWRPDDWIAKKLALPAHFVRRSREFEIADLLADTTPGNTYSAVTNISGGSEWDNGGDMYADLSPVIEAVALAANVDRTAIRIAVSGVTLTAMAQDAGFQATHSGLTIIDRTSEGVLESQLATYLGVGSVERILDMTDETGGREFADIAIVYTNGPDVRFFDTTYGSERWTAGFMANPGFAADTWREPMIRANLAAWVHQYKDTILKADCAQLVTNTSVAV